MNRVLTYKRPSEMLADGFTVNEPLYKAAVVLCSQPNKPAQFKIGRCVGAPTHTVTFKCTSAVQGDKYSVDYVANDGSTGTVTYTVGAAETTTTVATAIELLIEAIPGVASTSSTDTITAVTSTAGTITTYANWSSNFRFTDTTADPGTSLATDLAAIMAEDNDWYGLLLANDGAESLIALAAAFANTNKKLFGYSTADWGVQDSVTTTDVASDLKGLAYDHTFGLFNSKKAPSYAAAGWMGNRFPYVPGKSTWQFKTLTGVPVDSLSASQRSALKAKNINTYISLANVSVTQGGAKTAKGEYIDVIHFLDWQVAEIQFRVYSILVNSDKIPFTDAGIDAIVSAVMSAILAGQSAGGVAASPAPRVVAPKASQVDSSYKNLRELPNVEFTFTLAGAIHTADVAGTVS